MNKVRKVTAYLIGALLAVSLWSAASRSQDQRSQGRPFDDHAARTNPPAQQDSPADPGGMSAEEKLVRDVYARLMRYQSASRDELDASDGKQSGPEDYLTFELRNIHSGSIKEIYDRPLDEMVTAPGGAMVSLKPVYLSAKDGPAHAYYEAEWIQPEDAGPGSEKAGVKDVPGFADFKRYTSYDVRVHFQGKQFTYRAVALYQLDNVEQPQSAKPALVKILDNITSDMNTVYSDESPRVRSPWNKYVKTSLYLAVARTIKEAKDSGKPLRPADSPIGYLPGDDAAPNEKDSQTLAANAMCAGPHIDSITPDRGLVGRDIAIRIEGTGLKSDNELGDNEVIIAGEGPGEKLEITASNFQRVLITLTLRVAEDAPPGKHNVKVKVDGVESNSVDFFVQIPKALVRTDFPQGSNPAQESKGIGPIVLLTDGSVKYLDGTDVPNATHKCGAYRNLLYILMDQDTTPHPILVNGLVIVETFPDSERTGDNVPLITGAGTTNAEGHAEDVNAMVAATGHCNFPNAILGSAKQHFSITIGQKKYNLTTVIKITQGFDPNAQPRFTITNEIVTP